MGLFYEVQTIKGRYQIIEIEYDRYSYLKMWQERYSEWKKMRIFEYYDEAERWIAEQREKRYQSKLSLEDREFRQKQIRLFNEISNDFKNINYYIEKFGEYYRVKQSENARGREYNSELLGDYIKETIKTIKECKSKMTEYKEEFVPQKQSTDAVLGGSSAAPRNVAVLGGGWNSFLSRPQWGIEILKMKRFIVRLVQEFYRYCEQDLKEKKITCEWMINKNIKLTKNVFNDFIGVIVACPYWEYAGEINCKTSVLSIEDYPDRLRYRVCLELIKLAKEKEEVEQAGLD